MDIITSIRRFADALITALGVVFGLTDDPTAVPVPVRIDDRRG